MCKPCRVTAPRSNLIDPADLPGRACSAAAALELIGDRWSLLAVREVMFGHRRFSEMVVNTGAPRDRLAARLKALVEAGVLERRQYQDSPPRADYHLTPAGRALAPVLQSLLQWGDDWAVTSPPVTLRHRDHDFHGVWTCAECGEVAARPDLHRESNAAGDEPELTGGI